MSSMRDWISITRPIMTLVLLIIMSVPVAYAYYEGYHIQDWTIFIFGVLSCILIEKGSTVFNAWYDYIKGYDRKHGSVNKPYTNAPSLISSGRISLTDAIVVSIFFYASGLLSALVLYRTNHVSALFLCIVLMSAIFSVLYTTHLKRMKMPELGMFLSASLPASIMGYVLITGELSVNMMLFGMLNSLYITGMCVIDYHLDMEADRSIGGGNMATWLDSNGVKIKDFYMFIIMLVIIFHMSFICMDVLPAASIISLMSVILIGFVSYVYMNKPDTYKVGLIGSTVLVALYYSINSVILFVN